MTTRQRFHNETDTDDLTLAGRDDRAYYAASYYDKADRLIFSVDYGTNGGAAVTAPDNINAWPAAALVTQYVYSAGLGLPDTGRLQRVIGPTGVTDRTEHDLLGRVARTIEAYVDGTPSPADDRTTEYTYDGNDNVRTITAVTPDGPDGGSALDLQMTEYVYDAQTLTGSHVNSKDLLTEVRFPLPNGDSPSTSPTDRRLYEYNALGEARKFTDPDGTVHQYTYDVLGRMTKDEVTTLGAGVDNKVMWQAYGYASGGQLASMDSASPAAVSASVTWTYNGLGDQATQTTRGAFTGGNGSVTFAYSFNPAAGGANHSRLTSMTYPGTRVITYDYGTSGSLNDKISRVRAIRDDTTTPDLEAYSYLGLGTIVERDRAQPGTKLTYVFQSGDPALPAGVDPGDQYKGLDWFGRVRDQRWRKGSTELDRFVYTYDRSSNRTTKDVLGNSGNPGNLDEAYFYDPLGRLTKVNRGSLSGTPPTISDGASAYQQTWTLDGSGNWSDFVTDSNGGQPGGTITTRTKTHNRRNRITSISGQTTPTYDNNGNMTGDETGRVFKYDAWDRLVTQMSGSTETVRVYYDARGYRTERRVGSTSVYYHYTHDWQLVEERGAGSGGGPTQATYVWGEGYVDALVARDTPANGRQYAQQDANYNVTSLTNNGGTVQERYIYDPYGTVTYKTGTWGARSSSSYAWQHLHQGLRLDPTTNLLANRERDYSATLGRFNTTDPIGYADCMNLYEAYGSGPVTHLDPQGTEVATGVAIGVGEVLGGAAVAPPVVIGIAVVGVCKGIEAWGNHTYATGMAAVAQPLNLYKPQPDWGEDCPKGPTGTQDYICDDGRDWRDDKALTPSEIKKLIDSGNHPHKLKPNARYDLFKDKDGNIHVKPKDGIGCGDPTGININDL